MERTRESVVRTRRQLRGMCTDNIPISIVCALFCFLWLLCIAFVRPAIDRIDANNDRLCSV